MKKVKATKVKGGVSGYPQYKANAVTGKGQGGTVVGKGRKRK